MTTVDVVCFKYKPLKNGEFPLRIRVTKDRKVRYLSLGLSVAPNHWDFKKNCPKKNCPQRDQIEEIIANKVKEVKSQITEYKYCNKDFTASSLIAKVSKDDKKISVGEAFIELIGQLGEANRTGYKLSIQQTYNSLLKFNKTLDIPFNDIDLQWLGRYEAWLRKLGKSENTIGIRFRNLRMLFNHSIDQGRVKKEYYPFDKFKVSSIRKETAKRAITKEDVKKIINYPTENKDYYTILSIHLFSFSYYMGGINFVDMAFLTQSNIQHGRLVYYRKKTSKLIALPLCSNAQRIIKYYTKEGNKYLFPILSHNHNTEQRIQNRLHKVITKVNRALKNVGEELKLPIKLTTYVARHSFATVLKREGVSTSIISETLGHSSEKVTKIYLDSFDNAQVSDALSHLL